MQDKIVKKKTAPIPHEIAMYLSNEKCDKCEGAGVEFDSKALRRLVSGIVAVQNLTYTQVSQALDITPQILCDLISPENNPRRKWTLPLVKKLVALKGKA